MQWHWLARVCALDAEPMCAAQKDDEVPQVNEGLYPEADLNEAVRAMLKVTLVLMAPRRSEHVSLCSLEPEIL